MEVERRHTPVIQESLDLAYIVRELVHSVFAADIEGWRQSQKKLWSGLSVENKG